MKKNYIVIFFFFCTFGLLFAQNIQLSNDIPVVINGDTLYSPWSGAMNAPQFGQTDLNGDGKPDFVLFDRVDWTFTPYLNVSTQIGQKNYEYAPKYKALYDSCHCQGWAEFVDYDCDGDNDIFWMECVQQSTTFDWVQITVFNRWGQQVFESMRYDNTWNGTDRYGSPLPTGSYYFVAEGFSSSNGISQHIGYLNLFAE